MISRFGHEAEYLGYRRVIVNISGCQLYYRSEQDRLTALVFFECPRGDEFTKDQVENILEQVQTRFSVKPGQHRLVQAIVSFPRMRRGCFTVQAIRSGLRMRRQGR